MEKSQSTFYKQNPEIPTSKIPVHPEASHGHQGHTAKCKSAVRTSLVKKKQMVETKKSKMSASNSTSLICNNNQVLLVRDVTELLDQFDHDNNATNLLVRNNCY